MFKRNVHSINFVFNYARIIFLLVGCTLFFFQRSAWSQFADKSVLSENPIYKISTNQNGVHIITYSFLQQQLGFDLANIDPRNLHVYGNGGGNLPENIDEPRFDDLVENAITIVGEEDGRFDPDDYILFYGQSPDTKKWNLDKQVFEGSKNIYSDKVYFFIKADNQPGKRVSELAKLSDPTFVSSSYDRFDRFEEEKVNLLDNFNGASGTGQNWYGDLFSGTRERNYDFPISQINTNESATFKIIFAARSGSTSSLEAEIEGQNFSRLIGGVNLTDVEGRYARNSILEGTFSPQVDQFILR